MNFLAPLYIAGLLGIALPLLFHLIRRTPQGRQLFSSVMFLAASPPRLTRRSRLDQLLLLLLRAAAITLLALAFARPYLRQAANLDLSGGPGRRIAILVDTSASMRQLHLWRDAQAEVRGILDDLEPQDQVALFSFDNQLRTLVGFQNASVEQPRQRELIRAATRDLRPGWGATDLGKALVELAERMETDQEAGRQRDLRQQQIVLVSDLQQGSQLDALQAYQWPEQIHLQTRRLKPASSTNAGIQLMAADADESQADQLRVRLTNASQSEREQFSLSWRDTEQKVPPVQAYVPPGQSRILRIPRPAALAGGQQLVLSGDDQQFDNVLYVAPLQTQELQVLYVGEDGRDDPDGLRYYLERALINVPGRSFQIIAQQADQPLELPGVRQLPLVVLTQPLPAQQIDALLRYVEEGGMVLYVLPTAQAAESVARLLNDPLLDLREAEVADYQMLSQVNFSHPLFASLAAPRFSDFTKVQFWRYRQVQLSEAADVQVVARFDNGDPAVLERAYGRGTVVVLTSGWHREDSLLGRSSKFIPLLYAALRRGATWEEGLPQYVVHEPIALRDHSAAVRHVVYRPDGGRIALQADQRVFAGTDEPGLYGIDVAGQRYRFAVNVPAAESQTASLDVEQLEQHGIRLTAVTTRAEREEQLRQMRDVELESRQKLWKWFVVATLALLVTETWLAGRASRRPPAAKVPDDAANA